MFVFSLTDMTAMCVPCRMERTFVDETATVLARNRQGGVFTFFVVSARLKRTIIEVVTSVTFLMRKKCAMELMVKGLVYSSRKVTEGCRKLKEVIYFELFALVIPSWVARFWVFNDRMNLFALVLAIVWILLEQCEYGFPSYSLCIDLVDLAMVEWKIKHSSSLVF